MRWIAILCLTAGAAPLAAPHSLAAQDQLVRPTGVALAPAEDAPAAQRAPDVRSAERGSAERDSAERGTALAREFARYDADASPQASIPEQASAAEEAFEDRPEESRAAGFDSLSVPLKRSARGAEREGSSDGLFGGPVAKITGGLAVTLGLFAVVVVLARRGGGVHLRGLPREAFEVIGQTSIGPRQRLLVVRVGTQALVIGTSPAGIQRIAQIEDPDEAGQLIAQCRGNGAQAAFKSTLEELERQRVAGGFVDDAPPKRPGNLFLRA